ncbi:MAG: hypothetical protein AB7F99_15315 [Vicinamibacterales bacterium]
MPALDLRRIAQAAVVFTLAALVEFAIAIYVAFAGRLSIGTRPLAITASDVNKPLAIGVVCLAAAVLLYERAVPALRPKMARATSVIAAVALAASLVYLGSPMMTLGFPAAHDIQTHATYTFLFDRALSQGQFPVRWVEWIRPGYGQPLFSFYQVGLYYLVSLVHAVGLDLSTALKATVVGLWWAGAFFMFLLCRPFGRMPGLAAAAVFAWSPYLILDAYVRSSFPEMAAIAFIPAVIWSLDRALQTGRGAYHLLLAVALALMMLCHAAATVIAMPLVPAYCAYALATRRTTLAGAGWVAAACVLGGGLAAFYVIPANFELDHISIGQMASGYFDYHQHFVAPQQWFDYEWGPGASLPGPDDGLSLQVGIVQAGIAAAAAIAAIIAVARGKRQAAPLIWWLGVFALGLFMMTPAAAWLWELVPQLAFAQFPWRYFMIVAVAGGALAGVLVSLIENRTAQALVVLGLIVTQWYVEREYIEFTLEGPRLIMEIDDPDWPLTQNARDTAFLERAFVPPGGPWPPPDVGRWAVTQGRGTVEVKRLEDTIVALDVETSEGFRLVVNSRRAPGWRVWLDERESTFESDEGQLEVDVPAGTSHVEVRLTNTAIRTMANAISLASALLWCALLVWTWRARASRPGRD